MSSFILEETKVLEVFPHTNAEKLDLIKCYDWQVVVRKDQYKVGDTVIYVPVDSILTQELEDKFFGPDSKVKLHNHRVKSIKLRGQISQGLVLNAKEYNLDYVKQHITKYEPTVKELPACMQVKAKKKKGHSKFIKYTDIENFKYYDRAFQDGEQVYISEKCHGSAFRAGWFPTETNTLWKKFLKFINHLPEFEWCWGSRTVQIQAKLSKTHEGFKSVEQGVDFGDIYTKIVKQYDLKNKVPKGYAIYGEIVGWGVQKNYTYGCKKDEHKLLVYDILETINNKWLDFPAFNRETKKMDLPTVPKLYVGPFSKEKAEELRKGDSLIGQQKVREGIVIKSVVETSTNNLNRKILKFINDDYYLNKNNTDFH